MSDSDNNNSKSIYQSIVDFISKTFKITDYNAVNLIFAIGLIFVIGLGKSLQGIFENISNENLFSSLFAYSIVGGAYLYYYWKVQLNKSPNPSTKK
jgi:hypothetical protein